MAITIKQGQKVRAKITYKNTGQAEVTPSFRVPIRPGGKLSTWIGDSGDKWIKGEIVAPGKSKTITLASKQSVPSNWENGTVVSARLDIKVNESKSDEVAGSATARQYEIPTPKPKAEWIKIVGVGWQ